MSGGAALISSWVSPILSPVKERTGMVASSEVTERGLVWVLRELGLKVKEEEEESFGRKMEEEKNERDEGCIVVVNVAIFTETESESES